MRSICSGLLIAFFFTQAVAQDTTTVKRSPGGLSPQITVDVFTEPVLDPVTVTSSLNPLRTSATGRNILVIKGDAFAALPVRSLDELLRYIPGIEVQARGPFGSQSDIVIRGGTFQQVLVVVDGLRVNDPNTGHFTSYVPISPTEIDRIEILKGASSALYGSDAVGGVVNVITKTFAARAGVQKTDALVQASAGEYGLFNLNAGAFRNNGKTAWAIGVNALTTDGRRQRGIRGFVDAVTTSLSIHHRFSAQWQAALRTSVDVRKFAAQNFYTTFVSDTAQETVTTSWNQLQVVRNGGKNTLRLQAGYKHLKDSFSFNPRSLTNQSTSRLWQALLTDEIQLRPNTALTVGSQVLNKRIASNDRGNHNLYTVAGFVVMNHRIGQGERFTLSPAFRAEWNEISRWEAVPQLSISYRSYRKWQLRASGGKTVRDADFTERYNNYNRPFVASGRLGNPDLQPERSWSYEGGADWFPFSSLKLSATVFQRRHKDLIDYVTTPYSQMPRRVNLSPTGTYALAKNIAEVTTSGLETDVQYNKKLEKESLWATAGAVWLYSGSSSGEPSFYVSSHARLLTNFSAVYNVGRFTLSCNGIYKVRQPQAATAAAISKLTQDYFLLNAKADVAFFKTASAFVQVDNLFDRSYTDLLGAQMPRRWLAGGLTLFWR